MPSRTKPRAQVVAGKDGLFRVYEPRSGAWHGPFGADEAADFADELDRGGGRAPKRRAPAAATTLSLESYAARRHTPVQAQRPPEGVDPSRPYLHRSSSGAFYVWSPEEGRFLGPYESEQDALYRLGAVLKGQRPTPRGEQPSLFGAATLAPKKGQLGLFGNPRRCRCGRRGCPCSNPAKGKHPAPRPRRVPVHALEVQVRPRGPLSGRELHALQVLLEREGQRPSTARLPPGTAYPCSLPEIGRGVGGRDYAGTALACQVPPRGRGAPFLIVGRPVPLSRVRADARKWAKAHGASPAACEAAAVAAARGEHVPHALVERCPQAEEAAERYAMQHEGGGPVSFPFDDAPAAPPPPWFIGSPAFEEVPKHKPRSLVKYTYRITPGHQYDREGVSVVQTSSDSGAELRERVSLQDGKIVHDSGDFMLNEPAVLAAAEQTMRDRKPRVISWGQEAKEEEEELVDERKSRAYRNLYLEGGEGYVPRFKRRR